MKLFECQNCGQALYFENTRCESCGYALGFLPWAVTLSALAAEGDRFRALAAPERPVRFCANAGAHACNWLVSADSDAVLCAACRHNRIIPDLSALENLSRWQKLEAAKHQMFYSLLRLGLPLKTRIEDPAHGLAFEFLADAPDPEAPRVMTGHDNGVITVALIEADDAERERRRTQMHEPYRSLLGHFRHEVGHHFWDLLVRDGGRLEACRAVFGDERADYGAALQRHYECGPPADWRQHYVSQYASTHPWEDWAETWAHYLHIVDTLEMAGSFGVRVKPRLARAAALSAEIDLDPYCGGTDMREIFRCWLPLTLAMNSLNRAMGNPDLYPFVLPPEVVAKLGFVHDVVHRGVA